MMARNRAHSIRNMADDDTTSTLVTEKEAKPISGASSNKRSSSSKKDKSGKHARDHGSKDASKPKALAESSRDPDGVFGQNLV